MKSALALALAVLGFAVVSAHADQVVVKKKVNDKDKQEVTVYSVESGSCEIVFEAIRNIFGVKFVEKTEDKCLDKTGYEHRLKLYGMGISEIMRSGFFNEEKEIYVVLGALYTMDQIRCKLMKHAANSEDWAKLVKKYSNKPVEFHEETPSEFSTFIYNSGALNEVRDIFAKYGCCLTDIKIMGFRSISVHDPIVKDGKLIKFEHECIKSESKMKILPYDAVLYLIFTRNKSEVCRSATNK